LGKKNCAFDALLFDLGGTLIYFEGDKEEIIHQANHALARTVQDLGYDIPTYVLVNAYETRLQAYFGHRDEDLIEYTTRRLLKELLADHGYINVPEDDVRTALQVMYEVFEANWHVEEDALPVLKMLKEHGCKVGLVSNAADDDDVQRQVDGAGLRPYLDTVHTSAVAGMRKPHPKMFEEAIQALGVTDLSRVLMVGDRLNADIAGAKKMGMQAVWITRRVTNPIKKSAVSVWEPDAQVTSLVELLAWMENSNS
jgi:HAD superfamily hydrolase (TIGR01662 family)